jgi:hypothetical protein
MIGSTSSTLVASRMNRRPRTVASIRSLGLRARRKSGSVLIAATTPPLLASTVTTSTTPNSPGPGSPAADPTATSGWGPQPVPERREVGRVGDGQLDPVVDVLGR